MRVRGLTRRVVQSSSRIVQLEQTERSHGHRRATESLEILSEPEGLYEVIDGRVVEKPMGAYEVWLAKVIYDLVNPYVKDNSLGRVVQEMIFDLRPTVDRERRPDVAFISFERWARNRRSSTNPLLGGRARPGDRNCKPDQHGRRSRGKAGGVFPGRRPERLGGLSTQFKVYVYTSPTDVRVLALGDELDGGDVLPGFRAASGEDLRAAGGVSSRKRAGKHRARDRSPIGQPLLPRRSIFRYPL